MISSIIQALFIKIHVPYPWYMRMWNVHRMFVTYIYTYKIGIPKHKKNTYDFLVQVQNFLLPLSLKVLRHKERDTHSFYSCFSICPPTTRVAPVVHRFVWPQRAPKVDPSRSESSSQLTYFFKIPKILRTRFRCMTSFTPTGQPLSGIFYFDICERQILPARASTPVLKFAPN